MTSESSDQLLSSADLQHRRVVRANRQARWALVAVVSAIGIFSLLLIGFITTAVQQINALPPFLPEEDWPPAPIYVPAPTYVFVPTRTPPPPTPDALRVAAEARATYAISNTKPLLGPISGRLLQNTRDKVSTFDTDLDLTEFVLEATFLNPDNEAIGAWDYGFVFLSSPTSSNNQYRFIVNAQGKWAVERVEERPSADEPTFTTIGYSWVPEAKFNFRAGESNHLRLIVAAKQLYVYVNGMFLSVEQLEYTQHGNIMAATCLWFGDAIDGHYTRFRDFTVWPLLAGGTSQP